MRPPTEWLRGQAQAAWWRDVPDRQFRVWLNLLALAKPDADGMRVDCRMADLVALCGGSPATVKQALAELSDLGMCRAAVSSGRQFSTVVVLIPEQATPPEYEEPAGAQIIPLFPAKDLDRPTADAR